MVIKRLETSLECRNALYDALDMVKAVQAAMIRGVLNGHALDRAASEARAALDEACLVADEWIADDRRLRESGGES